MYKFAQYDRVAKLKFHNQKLFENHLENVQGSSGVFLILAKEAKERKDIAFRIKDQLLKGKQFEVQSFTSSQDALSMILSAFHSFSLFSQTQVIEINEVQLLSESDLKHLVEQTHRLGSDRIVIFSSSKRIAKKDLFPKETLVLDLIDEKPWDHKKRVMALLFEYVKKSQKTIAYEALEKLVDLVGIDYGKLLQQLEILICFVGTKGHIALDDLRGLSIAKKKQKTWQLAEYLTWGEGADVTHEGLSDQEFISLLNQIRFRLNVGIKIKEGIHPDDLAPSLLQKYIQYTDQLDKEYFKKALLKLYEIERFNRSHQFSSMLLFDILYMHLYDLREENRCQTLSQV